MEINKNKKFEWNIINRMFHDNNNFLVKHHLESYDDFYDVGLSNIIKENNPLKVVVGYDEELDDFRVTCELYIGGIDGNSIYYGKPIIYDDKRSHYMYPNEARLRNMTYGFTIHYDVLIKLSYYNKENQVIRENITLPKIYMGRFPIMLQSKLCIIGKLNENTKFNLGECKSDQGGYFIIDGKEKIIMSQEKFSDNMLYIKKNAEDDKYSYSAIIRNVSDDASKPVRTMKIHIVNKSTTMKNGNIVVSIPNVRTPIPLFIVMRALGILSDKSILEHILLNIEDNESYLEHFIPSIHDAGTIYDQHAAIEYIKTYTKRETVNYVLNILSDYMFPNIGDINFKNKAYFLGDIVFKLMKVSLGEIQPTDRDSFTFKRVELTGTLMYDLFKEYYKIQQNKIREKIDKEFFFHFKLGDLEDDVKNIIEQNGGEYFNLRIVEEGFKKAFKGNWGSTAHTKKVGVLQSLNRLSYNSYLSDLRKLILPLDSSAKVIGPRLLHSSQWGIIDPIDSPDGGNVGLHKHLAMSTFITTGVDKKLLINWLKKNIKMRSVEECAPEELHVNTKVFVNGLLTGVVNELIENCVFLKQCRRLSYLPPFTSIRQVLNDNELQLFTDSGRLCRPLLIVDKNTFSNTDMINNLTKKEVTWNQMISGYNYSESRFFTDITKEQLLDEKNDMGILDIIDTSEAESCYVALNHTDLKMKNSYTHCEIHGSLLLGFMGNQVIYPELNQSVRNTFSCGQSKQASSLYHTNYMNRMDKTGIVLNNGQFPLISSRYAKVLTKNQPYGVNTIVAIMCYSGYNVEDAILINEGAIKRGLFNTSYYNCYETFETTADINNDDADTEIVNINNCDYDVKKRPDYNYDDLSNEGIIKEGTIVTEKSILIGKVSKADGVVLDNSITPKKGQMGYVDKVFISEEEEGNRIAKVRICNERIPSMGDKFASRAGQKGTIGLVVPESNMPFTENGIRPDIIINPHAIPSRMTIGQIMEVISASLCCHLGTLGDCTVYDSNYESRDIYRKCLQKMGFNSNCNEILYDGFSGNQLESEIFIGPTYYMRLKHMVKDKINFRAKGPRMSLTRQTAHGRANDGGLRIGEMERDGILSHGASHFLNTKYIEHGDEYYMAICNHTGTIAAYNKLQNILYSPFADGPVSYSGYIYENMKLEYISKHGRNFTLVKVPYCFKLLLQELQGLNIQMRIITDDNIDQLNSLSFSDNYKKVTFNKHNDLLSHINETRLKLKLKKEEKIETSTVEKEVLDKEKRLSEIEENTDSPPFAPDSPPFAPDSPPFAPDSPPFAPDSPQFAPETPGYANGGPVYNPDSPVWRPNTDSSNESKASFSLKPGVASEGETADKISSMVKEVTSEIGSNINEAVSNIVRTVDPNIQTERIVNDEEINIYDDDSSMLKEEEEEEIKQEDDNDNNDIQSGGNSKIPTVSLFGDGKIMSIKKI
jgi:DNA-directed RNA polymerase II subunit RPB2